MDDLCVMLQNQIDTCSRIGSWTASRLCKCWRRWQQQFVVDDKDRCISFSKYKVWHAASNTNLNDKYGRACITELTRAIHACSAPRWRLHDPISRYSIAQHCFRMGHNNVTVLADHPQGVVAGFATGWSAAHSVQGSFTSLTTPGGSRHLHGGYFPRCS